MGLFLGSVHVRSSDTDSLKQALVQFSGKLGLEPVESDGDRAWTLVASDGWISVCDQDSLGDFEQLETVATALSAEHDAFALMVHDSDVLCLSLCRKGRRVDRFCSAPEILGINARFSPKQWGTLVSDQDRFQKALRRQSTFAEDALPELAALLSIPVSQLFLRADEAPPGAVMLRFRRRRTASSGGRLAKAVDPFAQQSKSPAAVITAGETVPLRFVMENHGPAFRGLDLEISGSALNLLEFGQAFAFDLSASVARIRRPDANLNVPGTVAGNRVSFPSLQVPDGPFAFGCGVLARVVHEGSGDLTARAIPAGDEKDALEFRVEGLVVKPALPTPLRYLEGMNSMFYVKQMANPRILSGVVILPGPSDRIVPAIERWVAAHQPGGPEKLSVRTIKHANLANLSGSLPRPRKFEVTPGDKSWKKLTGALGDYQSLLGRGGWYGFGVQISLDRRTVYCPHVSFWVEAARVAHPGLVETILEEFMGHGALQAFVARWDWIPEFDTLDNYDRTPYEAACGAQNGRNYMGARWVGRYLRGFGETVWYGSELAAYLESGPVGTQAGGFRRLACTPESEQSLAPLLATPTQYSTFDETI